MEDINSTSEVKQGPGISGPSANFLMVHTSFLLSEGVLALIGNSLILLSVLLTRELWTVRNLLLVSLAISDILGAVAIITPFTIYIIGVQNWTLWLTVCLVQIPAIRCSTAGNSWFTLLIAYDCYTFIVRPLHYHRLLSWDRAKQLLLGTWAAVIVLGGTSILISALNIPERGTVTSCTGSIFDTLYFAVTAYFLTLLPMFVSAWLYVKVLIVIRKQQVQIRAGQERFGVVYPTSHQKKMTITLVLAIMIYFTSTIPTYLYTGIIRGVGGDRLLYGEEATKVLGLFYRLNVFLNPVLLVIRHKEFRKAIWKVLGCRTQNQVAAE